MTEWLQASEALAQLGVRPQTLYAYVSRGRVHAEPDPRDPRRSRYRASDIAALANDPAPVCFRATYVYGSVEVSRYHGCDKP